MVGTSEFRGDDLGRNCPPPLLLKILYFSLWAYLALSFLSKIFGRHQLGGTSQIIWAPAVGSPAQAEQILLLHIFVMDFNVKEP